jgi:hypothetical protein
MGKRVYQQTDAQRTTRTPVRRKPDADRRPPEANADAYPRVHPGRSVFPHTLTPFYLYQSPAFFLR